jgi:hypothetical protein
VPLAIWRFHPVNYTTTEKNLRARNSDPLIVKEAFPIPHRNHELFEETGYIPFDGHVYIPLQY